MLRDSLTSIYMSTLFQGQFEDILWIPGRLAGPRKSHDIAMLESGLPFLFPEDERSLGRDQMMPMGLQRWI